jgi:hypothetical protein
MQAVGDGEGRTAVPALVHAHDAAAPADPAVDKVDGVRVRQRHLDEEIGVALGEEPRGRPARLVARQAEVEVKAIQSRPWLSRASVGRSAAIAAPQTPARDPWPELRKTPTAGTSKSAP